MKGSSIQTIEVARLCRRYRRTLKKQERQFGFDHPEIAVTLCSLANGVSDLGPPIYRVRPLYQRAVDILEKAYGSDDLRAALVLSNLGDAEYGSGDSWSAEEAYLRALHIQVLRLGVHDPQVAATLDRLADTADPLGWWGLLTPELARERYQRLLTVQEQALGGDEPRVAGTLVALAETWYGPDTPGDDADTWVDTPEDLDQARRLYERALRIRRQAGGIGQAKVVETLNGLGLVLEQLGQHDRAVELSDQVQGIHAELGVRSENPADDPRPGRPCHHVVELTTQLVADVPAVCGSSPPAQPALFSRRLFRRLPSANERLISRLDPDTGWADLGRTEFPLLRRAYTLLWATPAVGLALALCANPVVIPHNVAIGLVRLTFSGGYLAAFTLSAAEFARSHMLRTLIPAVCGLGFVFSSHPSWARTVAVVTGVAALAVLTTRPLPEPAPRSPTPQP